MKTLVSRLVPAVGLVASNFACQAQETKAKPMFARYYVEAYLARADYEVFYLNALGGGAGTSPWLVTVGRQLTPRWAVQLGYAYAHKALRENPSYTGTTLTGQYIYGWRSFDNWTHTLPFVTRFTVSRALSPLQVDIIGGLTWLSTRDTAASEDFVDGQSKGRYDDEIFSKNQLYVTGALGVRYAFTRHLEATFDYGYARNLRWAPEGVHLENTGNKWGLTRSLNLGVRYRFNIGKNKPLE
jgi:hypothetical protein